VSTRLHDVAALAQQRAMVLAGGASRERRPSASSVRPPRRSGRGNIATTRPIAREPRILVLGQVGHQPEAAQVERRRSADAGRAIGVAATNAAMSTLSIQPW
jgi:hypothetical protein